MTPVANSEGHVLGVTANVRVDATVNFGPMLYPVRRRNLNGWGIEGSSLSAFAGNVVLRDFDQRLNRRNIKTIRYIDDFVIFGRSEQAVRAAFRSASSILNGLGTTAHGPDEHTDKSKVGQVSDGFDFLGRSIKANKVSPSRKSKDSFLRDIRHTLNVGSQAIRKYASADTERRAEETFVQVVARVDRKIRG